MIRPRKEETIRLSAAEGSVFRRLLMHYPLARVARSCQRCSNTIPNVGWPAGEWRAP